MSHHIIVYVYYIIMSPTRYSYYKRVGVMQFVVLSVTELKKKPLIYTVNPKTKPVFSALEKKLHHMY